LGEVVKKRSRKIFLVLLALAVVLIVLHLPIGGAVTISVPTTRYTGPLNSDGTIDYVTALNCELSQGVTADNNAAVLLACSAGAEEKVLLRPQFAAGRYALTHTQEVEDGLATGAAPLSGTKSTVEFQAELAAQKPSAKGQAFELEFKRVRHTLREAGELTTYDSDKPAGEKNAGQPMLRALAGAKLRFVLDSKGRIASVSGIEQLWEKMRTFDRTIPPAGTDDRQGIQDFVVRDIVLLGQDLLPPKAVAAGERWAVERPWLPMQKQAAKVECTLAGVEGGLAVVECAAESPAAVAVAGGGDGSRQTSVSTRASLRVNAKTGLLTKLTLEVASYTTFKPGKDEKEAEPVQTISSVKSESAWRKVE